MVEVSLMIHATSLDQDQPVYLWSRIEGYMLFANRMF